MHAVLWRLDRYWRMRPFPFAFPFVRRSPACRMCRQSPLLHTVPEVAGNYPSPQVNARSSARV